MDDKTNNAKSDSSSNETESRRRAKKFYEKVRLLADANPAYKPFINNDEFAIYIFFTKNDDFATEVLGIDPKNMTEKKLPKNILSQQVSMSSFIDKVDENSEIWKVYSNFYVDFLISQVGYDKCMPVKPLMVIEYNGFGHKGNSKADEIDTRRRDYLKLRTLYQASIPFYIIWASDIHGDCYQDRNKILEYKLLAKSKDIVSEFKDLDGLRKKNLNYLLTLEASADLLDSINEDFPSLVKTLKQ